MKKGSIIILSILAVTALIVWFGCNPIQQSQQSANFNVLDKSDSVRATATYGEGFCTQNGGVTGGDGGAVVYASDYATFNSYTDSATPYIIYVTGSFALPGMECHVRSNKTIIGQGNNIVLSGGGLYIYKFSNIIIRNLTISGSSDDNIGIHYSNNIWIDHCNFIDSTDGNVDITQSSDYVTISWCKFYYTTDNGHDFVNLIAASDSDNGSQYHVTFCHNWWGTLCHERMPSVRFGTVHCYNNYYSAPGNNYCVRTRIGAQILVENNYFENVKNPWEQYVTSAGGTPGKVLARGNNVNFMDTTNGVTWYVDPTASDGNQSFLIPGTDAVFTPPYSYSLDAAASVKASVMAGAGVSSSITGP